ncbi:MAG: non-canonical purine NTP pyrophosphatase [Methylobacteriaceae bacterium]|jgi:XTP/dITP diphosphohydrolase|nr:non-canonical purine NTP pyrophosphatase [Methylobacteriaceae bacterium]
MAPDPSRRRLSGKLVIATHNAGKLREMREFFAPFGVEAISAGELGLPEPEETGFMFSQNAAIKAQAASGATGLPALADDSGLCVDALDGAPGLHSADFAGVPRDFARAMELLKDELLRRGVALGSKAKAHFVPALIVHWLLRRGVALGPQTKAHFVSALIVHWPDGQEALFEGRVFGHVVWPPRGSHGFGYDPMFVPNGFTRTFGELTPEEKHGIDWARVDWTRPDAAGLSHRARALLLMAAACLRP